MGRLSRRDEPHAGRRNTCWLPQREQKAALQPSGDHTLVQNITFSSPYRTQNSAGKFTGPTHSVVRAGMPGWTASPFSAYRTGSSHIEQLRRGSPWRPANAAPGTFSSMASWGRSFAAIGPQIRVEITAHFQQMFFGLRRGAPRPAFLLDTVSRCSKRWSRRPCFSSPRTGDRAPRNLG